MSSKEAQRLKKLKSVELASWATSFWVVHRKPAQPIDQLRLKIRDR